MSLESLRTEKLRSEAVKKAGHNLVLKNNQQSC
jgi:hypothetical protein